MKGELFTVFLIIAGIFAVPVPQERIVHEPEESMDACELITSKGYPCEEHEVQTADGYLLKIQRIPHGLNNAHLQNRPVAFLQHGLLCSSADWLVNLANESLGYIMADQGLDVWLGNFRGNTYGKKHIKLDPSDSDFWKFSWDEMAQYDLDATVNFALKTSNRESLYYVGHSEGTMTMFAKLSEDAEFAKKIKMFFALGPVTTVKYIGGLLKYIAPFTIDIEIFFSIVGYNDFLASNALTKAYAKYVCGAQLTDPLCTNVLFLIAGPSSHQINATRMPVYMAHTPAGTSTQNIVHFGQGVNHGTFQHYDYGTRRKNREHYQQNTPPLYHIENIPADVQIALFWGDLDVLADPKDVKGLIPKLKNLVGNFEYPDFNHLDFLWGLRAANEVYVPLINMIKADLNS